MGAVVSGQDVFRCDYCGQWTPTGRASVYLVPDGDYINSDGDQVWTAAVYCSTYCASQTASRVGGR